MSDQGFEEASRDQDARPQPGTTDTATLKMIAALVAAKREMWSMARAEWNMADFNNWAVIQQINAALALARAQPKDNLQALGEVG